MNWTQKQTAAGLGITLGQYQAYEEARAEPNICTLAKMSKLFNVTVDQLILVEAGLGINSDGKE